MQLSIDGGRGLAKLSVPVSKDRIMNDPSYDLFRKHITEFSGATLAVNSLMASFGESGLSFGDRYMRGRLQKVAVKALKSGPGRNGSRALEVMAQRHLFSGFELNSEDRFSGRFRVTPALMVNLDRNMATVTVPAFNAVRTVVAAPYSATHFRLCLAIGVVSDVVHASPDEGYVAAEQTLNRQTNLHYSAYHPCDGMPNAGFILNTMISGQPVLPLTAGLAVSIGIEFFKEVNGFMDTVAQGNGMVLMGIY